MTPHNRRRRLSRLAREGAHFQVQANRFRDCLTPQRRHTIARRCLRRWQADLRALSESDSDSETDPLGRGCPPQSPPRPPEPCRVAVVTKR